MKRSSKAVKLAVVPLLATAFLGCGDKETAYCVGPDNRIVENQFCDRRDNPSYFWWFGGGGYGRGSYAGAGERINSTDTAALARRGGFGTAGATGGVGRATGKTIGGGGFFSGGS